MCCKENESARLSAQSLFCWLGYFGVAVVNVFQPKSIHIFSKYGIVSLVDWRSHSNRVEFSAETNRFVIGYWLRFDYWWLEATTNATLAKLWQLPCGQIKRTCLIYVWWWDVQFILSETEEIENYINDRMWFMFFAITAYCDRSQLTHTKRILITSF